MRTIKDTWTMAKRSLRHIVRSSDTIITVVLMPIAMLLLFVYVLAARLGSKPAPSSTSISLRRASSS